jgi:hypothetical protein
LQALVSIRRKSRLSDGPEQMLWQVYKPYTYRIRLWLLSDRLRGVEVIGNTSVMRKHVSSLFSLAALRPWLSVLTAAALVFSGMWHVASHAQAPVSASIFEISTADQPTDFDDELVEKEHCHGCTSKCLAATYAATPAVVGLLRHGESNLSSIPPRQLSGDPPPPKA